MNKIPDKWIRNKSDEQAVKDGCSFSLSYAERVRTFLLKFCRQSIGEFAGKPLELLDWQWTDLIAPLYSWRKADGSRRFSSASIWIPKNNGKSTLCSGLSLYHLLGDGEQGAQVINLAATVDQAGIVYRGAADMVAQSPALAKRLWVRKNIKTIEDDKSRSFLRVMSGESEGKHGFSLSCLIFDELAEQADRELFDTMRHNCAKRSGSLMITISTAGFRRESIGYEQFQYAQKVKHSEIIDTNFLPVVYTAEPEDDWKTLETFTKCNPSYNVTIKPSQVKELLTEAVNEPRKESAYRTLRLNQWVGAATSWISAMNWAACEERFDEASLHGSNVYVGWDYGFKRDLCAYTIICEKNNLVYLMPRFFIPKNQAEFKQKTDHVPYSAWSRTPHCNLTLTDGDVVDFAAVRSSLLTDSKKFKFMEVGYDPTGLEESRQICERENGWTMVSVRQTAKGIGGAAGYFERLILERKLRHPGNPILSWCLENCATKETTDGLFIYKGSGETQRIDGIISTCIGLSRYLAREQSPKGPYVLFM